MTFDFDFEQHLNFEDDIGGVCCEIIDYDFVLEVEILELVDQHNLFQNLLHSKVQVENSVLSSQNQL